MTARGSRAATLRDVAERAGVSVSTASRVLSGGAAVRTHLADRVLDAAASLGYRPNMAARSLRISQSMTFGAAFFKLDGPPAWDIQRGLQTASWALGYATFIVDADGDQRRFNELIERLGERQIDALFVYRPPESSDQIITRLMSEGIPVIALSQRPRGMAIPLVTNRPTESIARTVSYLAELGHRGITYLGAAEEIGDFRTRLLSESAAGLGVDFHIEELSAEEEREFFEKAGRVLERLGRRERITAIFTRYAHVAGMVNAMNERGLRIPQDYSIISFGDGEWLRAYRPQIAALRAEPRELGVRAVQIAIEALGGGELERTYEPTAATLRMAESIGAPASRRPKRGLSRLLGS